MVPSRLVLVGVGAIGAVHLEALSSLAGVDVVAAVDLAPPPEVRFRGKPLTVYSSLHDALHRHEFDRIIVATPTPTHAAVCMALVDQRIAADVLVEKPLAANLDDVVHVLQRAAQGGVKLRVLYHAAHGPEVAWAAQLHRRMRHELGPVRRFEAFFADPYVRRTPPRTTALVSSWVDSGVNALSVAAQFVDLRRVSSWRVVADWFSTHEAVVDFDDQGSRGKGLVVTSWHVTEASKSTRLTFDGGAELVLDHTAVSARLLRHGRVLAMTGTDGAVPRLVSHYLNLYREVLSPSDGPCSAWKAIDDLGIHRLLLGWKEPTAPGTA